MNSPLNGSRWAPAVVAALGIAASITTAAGASCVRTNREIAALAEGQQALVKRLDDFERQYKADTRKGLAKHGRMDAEIAGLRARLEAERR